MADVGKMNETAENGLLFYRFVSILLEASGTTQEALFFANSKNFVDFQLT